MIQITVSLANKTPKLSDPPARLVGITRKSLERRTRMIKNNPNNTIVDDIRKAQQAKYNKEDNAILSAIEGLSLANYYLTNTFNVEENN